MKLVTVYKSLPGILQINLSLCESGLTDSSQNFSPSAARALTSTCSRVATVMSYSMQVMGMIWLTHTGYRVQFGQCRLRLAVPCSKSLPDQVQTNQIQYTNLIRCFARTAKHGYQGLTPGTTKQITLIKVADLLSDSEAQNMHSCVQGS